MTRQVGSGREEAGVLAEARLRAGHIHVWSVLLEDYSENDCAVLSEDEVARSQRFHFERDQKHFSRCRIALRRLLASYLQIPPEEICFEYSPTGKPTVSREQNPTDLQFNVSHSGGMALIAISVEHALGVDIERIRPDVDISTLAKQFFSKRECRNLASVSPGLRERSFFACWTRKEAFLKATGFGFSRSLSSFAVSTHPDLAPRIKEIDGDPVQAREWSLLDVPVGEGYQAAAAIHTAAASLSVHRYKS